MFSKWFLKWLEGRTCARSVGKSLIKWKHIIIRCLRRGSEALALAPSPVTWSTFYINFRLDRLMNINDGCPLCAITANSFLQGNTTTHCPALIPDIPLSQPYSKIYTSIYASQLANGNMPICLLLQWHHLSQSISSLRVLDHFRT